MHFTIDRSAIAVGLLAIFYGEAKKPITGQRELLQMKRGTRNNNPGNIKLTSLSWRGKVPNSENTDGTFEQFREMPYGIRALYRLLVTYVNKYKLRSVDAIIDRYAPSGENREQNRTNYKQFVKNDAQTDRLDNVGDLYAIARSIMKFETSQSDYNTYILPYEETARRITDLSDLKTLQPIVQEEKKKFPAKPILADIALAAFFVNIFSRK